MKKWFCVLLVLILILPGCAKEEPLENPVRFYYRRSDISHFDSTGALSSEEREAGPLWGATGDMLGPCFYLLNQYVKGPESDKLEQTFPEGSAVVDLKYVEDKLSIVVNGAFAQLTGIDLSLACACLTLTACEMTGAKRAEISAENGLLDGSSAVIMVYDQLVLEDLCRVPVEPN